MSQLLLRGIFCKGLNGTPIFLTSQQSGNNVTKLALRQLATLQKKISPTMLVASASSVNHGPLQNQLRASSHGDHTKIWTAEKALSGALLPIIPLAFMFPSNFMDYVLAFSLVLHSHWGIEAIVVDYVRPSIFGETIPKIGLAAVYALSAITLGGLCYFTYTDVGLVNAIKMLWKL